MEQSDSNFVFCSYSAAGVTAAAAASSAAESFTPYFQRVTISGDDNTGVSCEERVLLNFA